MISRQFDRISMNKGSYFIQAKENKRKKIILYKVKEIGERKLFYIRKKK